MIKIGEMSSIMQNVSGTQSRPNDSELPEMFDFKLTGMTDGLEITQEERILKKILTKYGLDYNELTYAGVNSASVKKDEKTGKEILVLKSTNCGYQLELPIDDKYVPEKIVFAAGEGSVYFDGINGTLKLLDIDSYKEFCFVNSDIEVHCCDGQLDRIICCDKNTKLKIHTNEFCDKYYDNTEIGALINTYGEETRLRPGTTIIDATK